MILTWYVQSGYHCHLVFEGVCKITCFWSQLSLNVLGKAEKCGDDDGSQKDLVENIVQVVSTFVTILLAILGILDFSLH